MARRLKSLSLPDKVRGVIDRGSYFQVRVRKMVDGKRFERQGLPRFNYEPGNAKSKAAALDDANAYALATRAEMRRAAPPKARDPEAADPTLGSWLDRFESEALDKPREGRVRQGAERERDALNRIRKVYAPEMLGLDVRDLKSTHFNTMATRMPGRSGKGAKPASIKRVFYLLAAVWNHNNGRKGELKRPWESIDLGAANDQRNRVVSDKEWELILEALAESPHLVRDAIVFTRAMACRRSETIRLRWEDTVVGKTPQTSTATFYSTKSPKVGEKRNRTLPLYPEALEVLRRLKKEEHDPEDRIFPIHADTLTHAFRQAVMDAGIKATKNSPLPRLHDLRHTRATELAKRFDVLRLMQVTGHKDIRSLARYVHTKPEDLL